MTDNLAAPRPTGTRRTRALTCPDRPRTGLRALRSRVKVRGFAAIDKRTSAARGLLAWRQQLVQDLGGEDSISAAQRTLIDDASRRRLYLDHLDAYLMELSSLITRRGAVKPVLLVRERLADGLRGVLCVLGLERRARKVPDLREYLEKTYGAEAAPVTTPSPDSLSEAPLGGVVSHGVAGAGSTVVPNTQPAETGSKEPREDAQ
jgi:hypothetical protein